MTPKALEAKFRHCLSVTPEKSAKLVAQNKALLEIPMSKISASIEFLFDNKITAKSIIENPWLLGLPLSK